MREIPFFTALVAVVLTITLLLGYTTPIVDGTPSSQKIWMRDYSQRERVGVFALAAGVAGVIGFLGGAMLSGTLYAFNPTKKKKGRRR